MKFSKASLAAAALVVLAPLANAAAFTNGSFEDSASTAPWVQYNAGSTSLAGWTIESGSIDLIYNYWTPSDGVRSIDLSGGSAGKISQSFDTVAGQWYHVSFNLSGNPAGGSAVKKLVAGVVGSTGDNPFSFNVSGSSLPGVSWTTNGFDFKALGAESKLYFTSQENSAYGAALDKVTVTAVPEPETFAMLLAGLGLIGLVKRRKSAKAAA